MKKSKVIKRENRKEETMNPEEFFQWLLDENSKRLDILLENWEN